MNIVKLGGMVLEINKDDMILTVDTAPGGPSAPGDIVSCRYRRRVREAIEGGRVNVGALASFTGRLRPLGQGVLTDVVDDDSSAAGLGSNAE